MARNDDEKLLRRHQKVVATEDMVGVPQGTRGKVILVNGVGPWIRYRVIFENGVDRGAISRHQLA